jgi:2-C-methyl-D-erythritol 2,4-cyclodiphosphate synthase
VEGRPLVIGGVNVPHEKGLHGHSDADVLAHALCDALLGAAGLKDMGSYYPDDDPAYRGVSSLVLLGDVAAKVRSAGYAIANVDSVVIAEAPKLSPYIDGMRAALAKTLSLDPSCVTVKARSAERLGPIGRGEGIAAQAVCLVEKVSAERK